MKLHEKKLLVEYAIPKMNGVKPFEIRKNDCDYEVGDLVHYTLIGCDDSPQYDEIKAYFEYAVYQIEYITTYEQYNGYIVYAEKKIN